MTNLWDGLCAAYRILGFESATNGDNVFRDLVLGRIIEPTSKSDTERVLREVGVAPARMTPSGGACPATRHGKSATRWRRRVLSAYDIMCR